MFMNVCLQRMHISDLSIAALATQYACVFSAATNQEGFSPVFHMMFISDLCIKKFKNDLNWNEKVFSCYLCVFKWMSLGYILQICFIKTLNVELCPCGSIIFIKLSSLCVCTFACFYVSFYTCEDQFQMESVWGHFGRSSLL